MRDDEKAAFQLAVGVGEESEPSLAEPLVSEWTLVLDHTLRMHAASGSEALVSRALDTWMLAAWPENPTTDSVDELAAHFGTTTNHQALSLADRWTRSVFSHEAGQLTSLTPGSQLFRWELTDEITLAGVGARRLFTDRDRAFVVSAEAGFVLSPRAGFQVGYELLQASAGGSLPEDAGGDALFARFQLRF